MITDDFMSRYEREYDFYQQAALLCQQRCELLLTQKGIRAIVTSRAKKYERLDQKIKRRSFEKKYKSVNDIYEDIIDLAGVRIALYFPGDLDRIDKLIGTEFVVKKWKNFPEPNEKVFPYEKRFSGYKARHYHVFLKEEHLIDERYSKVCIEIQVASVLMHAWAEVEHDLIYKPLSGQLSDDEHAILDTINGLALTGEIMLESLQKAQETRIGKKGSRFNDQYELATFLDNLLRRKKPSDSTMIMGRADVLFHFLRSTGLDLPEKLIEFIDSDAMNNEQTISDQIVDRILVSNSELYREFEKSLFQVSIQQLNSSSEKALSFFLARWIALDNLIKIYLGQVNAKTSLVLSNDSKSMIFKENLDALHQYEQLQNLRNDIVHGAKIPENHVLYSGGTTLEELLNELYASFPKEMCQKAEASEEIRNLLKKGK